MNDGAGGTGPPRFHRDRRAERDGKSTYTEGLAARGYRLGEVVNPDVIAANLPGPDATRDARAGRETLRRTRALIASGQMFSRETTLSGSEILRTMRAAKNAGFTVNLFFAGVDSVDISRARVRRRVERGGHGIPEQVQARRFDRSLSRGTGGADRGYDGVCQQHGRTIPKRGVMAWRADVPGLQWLDRIAKNLARTASTGC